MAPVEPESVVEPVPAEPAPAAGEDDGAPAPAWSPETPPASEPAPQWASAPAGTAVASAVHTPVAPPLQGNRVPKAKGKGSAGRIVLSVFLSILLCVSLLASALATVLKVSVTPDRLAVIVTDFVKNPGSLSSLNTGSKTPGRTAVATKPHTAVSVAASSSDGRAAVSLSSSDLSGIEDLDDLADYLYDLAKKEPGWENTTRDKIREALDSPEAEEFLHQVAADVAEDYTSVLLEGKKSDGKDLSEKLTEYVLAHEDRVEDVVRKAGFTGELALSERKLERAIRENMPQEIGSLTPEKLAEDNEELVSAARIVFSPLVFIGLWAITALLLVLLIVINRRRLSAVLYCVGIPALILGLVFLVGWCTMELYPAMKELPLSLIPTYMGKTVLLTGAGLTGGGVLLIVIKRIVRVVERKRG